MLLLDRANDPRNSVYYLAAQVYGIIADDGIIDESALWLHLSNVQVPASLNVERYFLALELLFLLEKIDIDERGKICVH